MDLPPDLPTYPRINAKLALNLVKNMRHQSHRPHPIASFDAANPRFSPLPLSGWSAPRFWFAAATCALCCGIAQHPLAIGAAVAQTYRPQPITSAKPIVDILSDKDLPTGEKGFARDYTVQLRSGERVEITVTSEQFDTVVRLLDSKGDEIMANDDVSKETTNSLIYYKVNRAGTYTVRVQSFGGSSGGRFTLRVERLRPVTD